jgi:6-phosphogluconolactonase
MPKLHIYKNEKETCYAFAEWLAELANETLNKQDRFTIALSGGDTPKLLYKILATDYASKIDWSRVHIFWGDERMVTFSDQKNNAQTAFKMFIDHVPVPAGHVHAIKTDLAPEESAKQYEQLLHSYFEEKENTFDLVVLGMGEQGNLLSLFPDAEENYSRDSWVIPVYDKQEDLFKISLTITAINSASVKAFLLTGKRKEDVVQKVLKGKYEPEKYPAQLIATANSSVHWFLDEGAAGKLIRPIS